MLGSGLLQSILNAPEYLLHIYRNTNQVVTGVLLEYIDAAAVASIGILLFPILRKYNKTIAFGYASSRIIECLLLVVAGAISLLLITLSQEYVQAGPAASSRLQASGTLLIAQSGLIFQIAMIVLSVGSMPFCYLLYKTRLVPRYISIIGLIGYASLLASASLAVLGYSTGVILYLPGAAFEIIFPIWLIVKGFNLSTAAKSDEAHSPEIK